jgi:hypothetical protein
VIQAFDFRDASDVSYPATGGRGVATVPANVSRYTGDSVTGGACLRIGIPASSGSDPGSWKCYLDSDWNALSMTQAQTVGMGATEFFIQYRIKFPSSWLVLASGTDGEGKKCSIISTGFNSNVNFEHVIQDMGCRNIVQAYHRTPNYEQFLTAYGGSDYKIQNSIASPYCLYSTSGSDYPNCWHFTPDVWMCFYQRIKVATYGGSSGNIYDLYAWKPGDSGYTQLMSYTGQTVGSEQDYPNGFNGLWLLPYTSGRTSSTVDSYVMYDQVIVSTSAIACPTA